MDYSVTCSNCGKMFLSTLDECPFCGTSAAGKETKNEDMLTILKRCKITVDKVFSLQSEISGYDEQMKNRYIPPKKGKRIFFGILIFYISTFLSGFLVILITRNSYIGSVVGIGIGAIIVSTYIRKLKSEDADQLKQHTDNVDSLRDAMKNCENRLMALLRSEEGRFAIANIPKDYFYPNALERFIFYFTNGHVDTMKEAVREYDAYVHNCRMEYEAARSAAANERAADAAERAARASETTARNTASIATIEQYVANINFWMNYEAFRNIF